MKKLTKKLIALFFIIFFINIFSHSVANSQNIINKESKIVDTIFISEHLIITYQYIDPYWYKVIYNKYKNTNKHIKLSSKFTNTYNYKKILDPIINSWKNQSLTKENIIKLAIQLEIEQIDVFFHQVIIESGNLTSKVCKFNNNIKGMRLAKQRFTYAIGSKNGYAIYDSWIYSIADYKIWQIQNPWKKDKESYGEYLDRRRYCSAGYGRRVEKASKHTFKKYKDFYDNEKNKYIFIKSICSFFKFLVIYI